MCVYIYTYIEELIGQFNFHKISIPQPQLLLDFTHTKVLSDRHYQDEIQ